MANVYDKTIVTDGPRNAVVRLTGVLDTSDAHIHPAVRLLDFLTNDPIAGVLYAFRIDHITFAIGAGIELLLSWGSGDNPEQLAPLSGRGKLDVWPDGGWIPNIQTPGFDGSIWLDTSGFITGKQNYLLAIAMVKLYR